MVPGATWIIRGRALSRVDLPEPTRPTMATDCPGSTRSVRPFRTGPGLVAQVRAGVPPATRHLERQDLVDLVIRQFLAAYLVPVGQPLDLGVVDAVRLRQEPGRRRRWFRLQLRHDNDLVNGFFAYDGRILAQVATEDDTPVFTGYVAPTFEQVSGQVVTALSLELLDNSYLLDETLAQSFQYPATVGGTPYKILSKTDPTRSIVHQLLAMAGYPVPDIISASCPEITQTVLHIAGTEGDETYRDLLDGLLEGARPVGEIGRHAVGRIFHAAVFRHRYADAALLRRCSRPGHTAIE